eukprot:scaffold24568_cov70-Phaeocystis_antarctica.AAC.6
MSKRACVVGVYLFCVAARFRARKIHTPPGGRWGTGSGPQALSPCTLTYRFPRFSSRLNQTRKRRHCSSKYAVASHVAQNSFPSRKTNCSAVQESSGSSPPVRWLCDRESSRIAIPRRGSSPPVSQL